MSGFRAFLLRGNLIELAVAFIIGAAFSSVVKSFVALMTSLLPASSWLHFDENTPSGAFYNSLISFVLLAAVVYFFVVVPYTKAKDRFFPVPPPTPSGDSPEVAVLKEIRDSLQKG
jgi:large conductance mechanosensitive channel